jgi:hypothetical protein
MFASFGTSENFFSAFGTLFSFLCFHIIILVAYKYKEGQLLLGLSLATNQLRTFRELPLSVHNWLTNFLGSPLVSS